MTSEHCLAMINEAKILEIADQKLAERGIEYDVETGLEARYKEADKLRDGRVINTWIVYYLTPVNPYFDQDSHHMRLDAETGEFLYIITPISYID